MQIGFVSLVEYCTFNFGACVNGECNEAEDRCDCPEGWAGKQCDTGRLYIR